VALGLHFHNGFLFPQWSNGIEFVRYDCRVGCWTSTVRVYFGTTTQDRSIWRNCSVTQESMVFKMLGLRPGFGFRGLSAASMANYAIIPENICGSVKYPLIIWTGSSPRKKQFVVRNICFCSIGYALCYVIMGPRVRLNVMTHAKSMAMAMTVA